MEYILNQEEMQAVDAYSIESIGIPGIVLMERAASAFCDVFCENVLASKSCLIVTEKGNNGGDGLAIARILYEKGYEITVFEIGKVKRATPSYECQRNIIEQLDVPVTDRLPERDFDVIIDAVFGVGLTRKIEGIHKEVIESLNQKKAVRYAVDIPSGICANTGQVLGCAFCADVTVTFGFKKIGLLLYPGAAYAGQVVCKDIGFPRKAVEQIAPNMYSYDKSDVAKVLPKRCANSHKGTYGRLLVVAGQKNMAGAAYFNAFAAYRTGCGIVKILTHESNRIILQTKLLEAILETYSDENEAEHLLEQNLNWADAVVIGSGLGTGPATKKMLLCLQNKAQIPVVADADALNTIAAQNKEQETDLIDFRTWKAPLAVTPHLMEMSRLTKMSVGECKNNIIKTARAYAKEWKAVCVLKDAKTITAMEDGTVFLNQTGNSGMATAGSGDVLAGIIGGLCASGMAIEQAASFGVYLHSLAGDTAKKKLGEHAMMATDLIESLSAVLEESESYNAK